MLLLCSYKVKANAAFNKPQADSILKKDYILQIMDKVADWQLNDWHTNGFKHAKVDWTNAACYTGIYALGAMKHQEKYLAELVKIGNDLIGIPVPAALWQMNIVLAKRTRYCIQSIMTPK